MDMQQLLSLKSQGIQLFVSDGLPVSCMSWFPALEAALVCRSSF